MYSILYVSVLWIQNDVFQIKMLFICSVILAGSGKKIPDPDPTLSGIHNTTYCTYVLYNIWVECTVLGGRTIVGRNCAIGGGAL